MILGDFKGRSNNLHIMRFLASLLVIYSHAFPAALGRGNSDILNRFTNDEISLGGVSVAMFFLCSGYLIAKSSSRQKRAVEFFSARLIRLLPPLALVITVSVILGAFLTKLSFAEYFSSPITYKYLLNILLFRIYELPGVFTENPYDGVVNGSLWTLQVEFLCYIVCFLFARLGFFDKKRYLLTMPFAVITILAAPFLPKALLLAVRPCLLFYIGMGYFVFKDSIRLQIKWFITAVIGFAVSFALGGVMIAFTVFFPYIMFVLWFGVKQLPDFIGSLGNYSYGIYLWGFLVQQILMQVFGEMSVTGNFVCASAISVLLAVGSYYLTEKPLEGKKLFVKKQ